MTYIRETVTEAAVGVAIMDEPEDFSVFKKPGVAAAIWRRRMPVDFQSWIDELPDTRFPSTRILTTIETVRETVMAVCNSANVPYSTNRRLLINDVADLATRFAHLMDTDVLKLRFDVVKENACRKFHIDALTARLVCTYRGPGTQYGISTNGDEPKRVFSVPTGSPILLRGTKWQEPPESGLLHRSPPIEGTGKSRLMVVLDPVCDEGK